MFRVAFLAVALVFALPIAGHSAVVGTFTAVGDQLTAPIAFDKTVFNSFADIPGGLQFAVAPGLSGNVKLELLQSTANVKVAVAAIGGAFGITQSLPLVLVSNDAFVQGIHDFAVGAVTAGSSQGAIIARLTLTPLPGALLLLGTATAALATWNFARRRPESPEAV